ncbi:helix-turn-helix transcriptional regulator, partial [Actinotignum timonense]
MGDLINKSLVSDRLKELRQGKNYTQQDVADIIGVGYESAKSWENSRALPRHEPLAKLAKLYGVSIDYIL